MLFNFLTYNKFKFRNWDRLSLEDRAQVFQKLENIQAKKLHRPPAEIIFKEMDERQKGAFNPTKNCIFLNMRFIQEDYLRFDGMFTLFHEGRHAFQHYAISENNNFGFFSKAKKWKENFKGYLSGSVDEYAFYAMQPVERDANKYALSRLKSFLDRFSEDRYFIATLSFEEKCFYDDKFRAKNELGLFYNKKITKRFQEESEKNGY